jgi:hypothetical protein
MERGWIEEKNEKNGTLALNDVLYTDSPAEKDNQKFCGSSWIVQM